MKTSLEFQNMDKDTLLVEMCEADPVSLQLSTIYFDAEDNTEEVVAFIAINRHQAIKLAHKILEVLA